MKRLAAFLAVVLLANSAYAWQRVNTLTIPSKVEVGTKIVAVCNCAKPDGGKLSILWNASASLETVAIDNQLFIWGKPGHYRIDAVVIPLRTVTVGDETFDVIAGAILRLDATFTITGKVDPDPPDPDPDPTDAPFPAPGLAVMIVREAKASNTPPQQRAIFTSSKVLKWLNDNCHKENGQPLYRVWDDDYSDAQLRNVGDVMRTAYQRTKEQSGGKLPWIAISTGKTGTSQALPGTVDETLKLLRRFK